MLDIDDDSETLAYVVEYANPGSAHYALENLKCMPSFVGCAYGFVKVDWFVHNGRLVQKYGDNFGSFSCGPMTKQAEVTFPKPSLLKN